MAKKRKRRLERVDTPFTPAIYTCEAGFTWMCFQVDLRLGKGFQNVYHRVEIQEDGSIVTPHAFISCFDENFFEIHQHWALIDDEVRIVQKGESNVKMEV